VFDNALPWKVRGDEAVTVGKTPNAFLSLLLFR
jgi:hypothetical protein